MSGETEFVRVPREPTAEMLEAEVPWEHEGRLPAGCRPFPSRAEIWAAMIAASPAAKGEKESDRLIATADMMAKRMGARFVPDPEKVAMFDAGTARGVDGPAPDLAKPMGREEIARIIDPLAFQLADALNDAEGEPEQLRADATAMRDKRLSVALAKADAIERLQAELDRAVEVMKPFAEAAVAVEEAGQIVSQSPDETSIEAALWESQQPTVGHLRAARSFIASRRGG